MLQGSPGNPTGLGARLTLTLADGTTRTTEITAASGYYSQPRPAIFLALSSPPRSLHVRWPDGRTSEHTITADATGTITIKRP